VDDEAIRALKTIKFPPWPDGPFAFRFLGGPRDGEVDRADRRPEPGTRGVNYAQLNWIQTAGTVGVVVKGTTPQFNEGMIERIQQAGGPTAPIRLEGIGFPHEYAYEIVSREDCDGVLTMTCEYRGISQWNAPNA
jgi:hypothetical protein